MKRGYVEVAKRVQPSERAARKTFSELLDEARAALRSGRVEESLRVIEEATPLSPHDIALRSLRDEARAAFVYQVSQDSLAPARVPVALKPLESLTEERLTPEEVFILTRVNGSWDIRSIVSLCPFPEAEALVHLKRLQERGILSIQAAA